MAGPLRWNTHASFARGMVQDVPRHLLPDDAVWDADDFFIKRSGALAKRGGTTTVASPYSCGVMGAYASRGIDALERIYFGPRYQANLGFSASANRRWSSFIPGTSPTIETQATGTIWQGTESSGVPFQHGNYIVFPCHYPENITEIPSGFAGAAASFATRTNAASVPLVAGENSVTIGAADAAAIVPGAWISASSSGAYYGRVTSISGTTMRIEPTPTATETFPAGTLDWSAHITMTTTPGNVLGTPRSAARGASWQNRVLWGDCRIQVEPSYSIEHRPDRLMWSVLPTETTTTGSMTFSGAIAPLSLVGCTEFNYVDIPYLRRIESIRPIGQGSVAIFGSDGIAMLVGNLETITTTAGGAPFSVQQISTTIGALSDHCTVTTPAGVMFAAQESIFLFDGSRLTDLLDGKLRRYWQDNFNDIPCLSAFVLGGQHFVLSALDNGLMMNMNTGGWTRFTPASDVAAAAQEQVSDRTRVWGGSQSGSGDTSGIVFRLDPIINPSAANTSDATAFSPISATIKTKTYPEGDPHNLNRFRHTGIVATVKGTGATITVEATPGLEAEEAGSTLGTISASSAGPQRKRYDHQIIAPAIGYTLTTAGAAEEAEVLEVRTATNALRPGRTT